MRLLAIYTQESMKSMRRIQAPWSQLTRRGIACSFMQVEPLTAGFGFVCDALLVQDACPATPQELAATLQFAQHHPLIYDLTDLSLLAQAAVRQLLAQAALVTVPTPAAGREIQDLARTWAVLPSAIETEAALSARMQIRARLRGIVPPKILGCFGPGDWKETGPVLVAYQQRYPGTLIVATQEAAEQLPEGLVGALVDLRPQAYFPALAACHLLLVPPHHPQGRDPIWEQEAAFLGIPSVHLSASTPGSPEQKQVAYLRDHVTDGQIRKRALAGVEVEVAKVGKVADVYLRTYRKKLPQFLLSQ